MQGRLSLHALTLSFASLLASAAAATTFVHVSDQDLARRAPVIAEVTVLSQASSPSTDRPATDYIIHVDRLLQGTVAGSSLVVRVPGGGAVGETGLKVWGAPAFHDDERALLFLVPDADGSYRIVDLMLGAFHEIAWNGRRLAVRDLAETGEIAVSAAGAQSVEEARDELRDFARFAAWLDDRARGVRRPLDYQAPLAAGERREVERLARPGGPEAGLHAAPGAEIGWFADLADVPVAEAAAFQGAVEALQTVPTAQTAQTLADDSTAFDFAGTTRSLAGLDRFDGHSSILFGNPGGYPDLPAFACGAGGLASISGTWFDGDRQVLGGDVILAAGVACLFAGQASLPAAGLRALLAHDLPQSLAFATAAAAAADPLAALDSGAPQRKQGPSGGVHAPPTVASAYVGRGYHPRACGFDLNRNGIFGETADCHLCDGQTKDPFGDGGKDNLVYVACGIGSDNPGCGSPGNPCASIKYAWNSRTLPAGSAGVDVICFRGTCHEDSITPGVSGRPGYYTLPKSGSAAQDWQLPTHPTMLVGWDYNHNGQYPPYDTADTAILDGTGLAHALALNVGTTNSYVELAHFTVRNYGTGGSFPAGSGFATLASANGVSSYLYFHDISVQNVNAGQGLDSNKIIFNFFGLSTTQLRYVAVENVQIANAGGYLARGSGPTAPGSPESGPFRFKNVSYTALGCNDSGPGACQSPGDEAHVVGFKLWGYITGVEVLDSVFDLNTKAWTPHPSGFGSTAFLPAQCSRNWTIRNNEIDNFKVALTVQGYAEGFCDGAGARPLDNVMFDRNQFRNTYSPWVYGNNGVTIMGGGPNSSTSVGRVLVSNNFFSSTPGWQGMAYIDAGNNGGPDAGAFQFVNNTTVAALSRPGFGALTLVKNNNFPPQVLSFRNNVVSGLTAGGGQENVHTEYIPAAWDADSNVFDPNGVFTWNRTQLSNLAAFHQASGRDGVSRLCLPSFVNPGAGDFHLNSADSCAKDAGTSVSTLISWDIDGNPRPVGLGWDIGAHEVQH